MPRTQLLQTNFTAGELGPAARGRSDLAAYPNGAAELTNAVVAPTGGASRRGGLAYVAEAAGPGRLIAMRLAAGPPAVLACSDRLIRVYRGDALEAELAAPWRDHQLAELRWAQSADVLLLTHPEVPPQRLLYNGGGAWNLADWPFFETSAGKKRLPLYKFAPAAATLQPDATTGTVRLTASVPVFAGADHLGVIFDLKGRQVEITAVESPTEAQAQTRQDLVDTQATIDWREAAISPARGWPIACAFHQNRLVIGGTRDRPHRLWLSRTADLYNFHLGEGQADAAIALDVLGDRVEAIAGLVADRRLQIFTSAGEWQLEGEPLTPAKARLVRYTRHGSPVRPYVPPQQIDGETVFAARQPGQVLAFRPDELGQRYASADLALLAPHLAEAPVDATYDPGGRQYYLANRDGTVAVATLHRRERVVAWSRLATAGAVESVATAGLSLYALVRRPAGRFLERLDPSRQTDSAVAATAETPQRRWTGWHHLEGETVRVRADGADAGTATVADGALVLDRPASTVEAGLAYRLRIVPLAPAGNAATGPLGPGAAVRLVRAAFQLQATAALTANTGSGWVAAPLRGLPAADGSAPQAVTGIVRLRGRGWQRGAAHPLWRIDQDAPLPCTVLAVSSDLVVSF